MTSRLIDNISPETFQQTYIKTQYSPYTRNQVQKILNTWIEDHAISREEVEGITIDGLSSLDLDDAVWIEKTQTEWYCVWIHISDVSETIPIYSPLDLEALHRTTSIYRKNHILDMIPQELSNGILSLDANWEKKLTYSLQIDIDNQGSIQHVKLFESRFKSLKRYDYGSFWDDYIHPDSPYFTTLHTLKEVSDILRAKRLMGWWMLNFNDDNRKLHIWDKISSHKQESLWEKVSHDIIESLMVLWNTIIGDILARNHHIPQIFKRHDNIWESSFYYHKPAFHHGLQISNYTHFSSPIRRYVDIVIHRILKALQRKDIIPYTQEDMKFIAEHCNNTRWKVENLWKQIDMDTQGEICYQKQVERLWRPLEVFDMKCYIRNATDRSLKLPKIMRDAIAEKINHWKLANWIWSAWVILVWQDRELKELIYKKVFHDRVISYKKFIFILEQTCILRGQDKIFSFTYTQGDIPSIYVTFQGKKIVEVQAQDSFDERPHYMLHELQKQVIYEIFKYFSDIS